jgi:hypothetical protein
VSWLWVYDAIMVTIVLAGVIYLIIERYDP